MLSPSSLSRPVVASAVVLVIIGLVIALAIARSRYASLKASNLAIGSNFVVRASAIAARRPAEARVLLDCACAYGPMDELTCATGIDCANLSMNILRALN